MRCVAKSNAQLPPGKKISWKSVKAASKARRKATPMTVKPIASAAPPAEIPRQ